MHLASLKEVLLFIKRHLESEKVSKRVGEDIYHPYI